MNYIWGGLIIISIVFAGFTGRIDAVLGSLFDSVQMAVKVAFSLIGIMAFWLGIVKIAEKAGLIELFSKAVSPILRLIFNELPKDSPAFSNIALNFSANALGLSNAATPFGIKAMENLKEEGQKAQRKGDTATNSMCIFLGMNTAGFQIIPASVIAILASLGAKTPYDIIIPTFIVTSFAFVFAIFISKALAPLFKENFEGGGKKE